MKRVGRWCLVMAIACATVAPGADAAKPKNGVFGVINGKKFKAPHIPGMDLCVSGIYNQTQGVLVFGAVECKPRRRRQGVPRKNYKTIIMGCNINYDMPGPTPRPLAVGVVMACPSSAYTETKTGRFHIARSMATWVSDSQFVPDGITSNLKARIDSFDGSIASGVIFGSFDQPQNGQAAPAAIQGEIRFRFPFKVQ